MTKLHKIYIPLNILSIIIMAMSFGAIITTNVASVYAQISHLVGMLLYIVTIMFIIHSAIQKYIDSVPDELWEIYEHGYNDAHFGKDSRDKYTGKEQQWYIDGQDKWWEEFNTRGV